MTFSQRVGFGFLLLLSTVVGIACLGDDPNLNNGTDGTSSGATSSGATSGSTPANGGSIVLKPVVAAIVKPGETVKIPVTIERTNVSDPVQIKVEPLPTGVAAAPLTLSADGLTGNLELTAAPGTAQATAKAKLIASASPTINASVDLDITIRGAAGEANTTFGDKGALTVQGFVPIAAQMYAHAGGVAILGYRPSDTTCAVAKISLDGRLDPGFGTAGLALLAPALANTPKNCGQLVVGSDGKLVVARTTIATPLTIDITRLTSTGAKDMGFGTAGSYVTTFATMTFIGAVEDPLKAGDLFVAGQLTSGQIVVKRIAADGKAIADVGTVSPSLLPPNALGVSKDGKPLVVGFVKASQFVTVLAHAIVTGLDAVPLQGPIIMQSFTPLQISTASDGGAIISGTYTDTGASEGTAVLRIKGDGAWDTQFAGTSDATAYYPTGALPAGAAYHLRSTLVDPSSGHLVSVGAYKNTTSETFLLRRTSAGIIDTSFGDQGVTRAPSTIATTQAAAMHPSQPLIFIAQDSGATTSLIQYWR